MARREFDKGINVNGTIVYFSFSEYNIVSGRRFFVMVYDKNEHIVFRMKNGNNGQWVIIDEASKWIIDIESSLSDIISQETGKVWSFSGSKGAQL